MKEHYSDQKTMEKQRDRMKEHYSDQMEKQRDRMTEHYSDQKNGKFRETG